MNLLKGFAVKKRKGAPALAERSSPPLGSGFSVWPLFFSSQQPVNRDIEDIGQCG